LSELIRYSPASKLVGPLDYQEVRLKPPPIWSQALVWSIIGTAILAFVYACTAKIDEVIVATGDLQAQGATRPIMAPSPGVVSKIFVKEGDTVVAGQPLLKFDADVSQKRVTTLNKQIQLEIQRLSEQNRAYQARQESLAIRKRSLQASVDTEALIEKKLDPLVGVGAIQMVQLLQQKNKVQGLRSEVAQADANIREVQAEKIKTRQEALRSISDLERQLLEASKAQQYEVMRSPLTGLVFNLIPSSPGYSANPNEVLLNVVPRGAMEAKVFLTNRDVGFARPGQAAQVRVDAFPFTQFGSISGHLKSVATDSLPADQQNPQPRFHAYVSLRDQYLSKEGVRYPVRSGQSVTVNLVLREKRVITLITDAVEKTLDSLRRIRSGPT
jgi:HlyD family secretion protein